MLHIIIILLVILSIAGSLLWVIKTQRHSDALFILVVSGSVFAFIRGVDLLGPLHPDGRWPGVALITVSLTVTLVAAIAFMVRSRRSAQQVSERARESTLAEHVVGGNGA